MSALKRQLDEHLIDLVRASALERLFLLCKRSTELPGKPLSDFSGDMHKAQAMKRMAIDASWKAVVRQTKKIEEL